MTTAPALLKKKRRKMKQMQGLLLLSRSTSASSVTNGHSRALFSAPRKALVALQPQQQQLAYSAQEDQDMTRLLGRVDLRGAQLEQLPDGFVVHERAGVKKLKLQDRDKATTDAWFFGVYAAITEFARLPIPASEYHAQSFSAVLSASLLDESTDEQEFELSCQLTLPARPMEKPSVRWKTWKTFAQLQAFDDNLRVAYGAFMKKLLFPRERKRDSLFGGLRKKHKQEIKEQQLALYIEQVFAIPGVASDPRFLTQASAFLEFDSFFEIKQAAGEDEVAPQAVSNQVEADSAPLTRSKSASSANEGSVPNPEPQSYSEQQAVYAQGPRSSSTSDYESSDVLPPLSRTNSQFEDVGTEYIEILPETDPTAAKQLHKSILERVRDLVAHDADRVREFQEQTKYFGRDEISTTEYCAFLLGAFGSKECCQLIPMMARLLPDDAKRNELMDGRSAIWRRTVRRNRRRSKQFSESVVFQQQRDEAVHEARGHKTRPKSDSLTALQWYQDKDPAGHAPSSRHSMIETPSAAFAPLSASSNSSSRGRSSSSSAGGNQESGIDTAPPPAHQKPMLDPRRKLQHRASFNQFSDAMADPIQEETPTALDSDGDDDNQSAATLASARRNSVAGSTTGARGSASLERKSSLAGAGWTRRSQSLSNVSSTSSAVVGGDDNDNDEAVDYRHRRSHLKSELESAPPPEQEVNPVLARLKKQGAINFMMR
ncbi:hypothetical protein PybrP1_008532 [[Pythium] brassicae (nom. inval.)]|nr:hypothetical protein PybrP1_008532 [[Pythium] brassicae (nom. inval.)]